MRILENSDALYSYQFPLQNIPLSSPTSLILTFRLQASSIFEPIWSSEAEPFFSGQGAVRHCYHLNHLPNFFMTESLIMCSLFLPSTKKDIFLENLQHCLILTFLTSVFFNYCTYGTHQPPFEKFSARIDLPA